MCIILEGGVYILLTDGAPDKNIDHWGSASVDRDGP